MVLATMVSPSVPAEVTMEFERPDGTQLVLEGRANSQGIFKQPESVQILDEPGVYTLRAHARYGKATGAF
ncbi:MAG: hypothetical protein M5R36_14025 [Deltaproteobacteria bacterium]|nr:hypothetical protein [Deltaproteobacteria bacterium]